MRIYKASNQQHETEYFRTYVEAKAFDRNGIVAIDLYPIKDDVITELKRAYDQGKVDQQEEAKRSCKEQGAAQVADGDVDYGEDDIDESVENYKTPCYQCQKPLFVSEQVFVRHPDGHRIVLCEGCNE